MDDRASHRPATQLHRSISPWGVCETRRVPDNIPFARHTDTLHPPFHPPKRHPSHHPRFTFQPLYGNDSRGFPTVVQACPARHVQNTELTDCRLLGDEKNASAGNPKERESRNRHDMAGDSGVSEARQGGSERPRRGCFRRQEARSNSSANRCKRPRQRTPCPTILRNPIDSTASKVNSVLPKRGLDTLPCVPLRLHVTHGRGSVPRDLGERNPMPGEKRFLDKNGVKRLLFDAACVDWDVVRAYDGIVV